MKALFIIAPEEFRDEELIEPLDVLEDAGVPVTIASQDTILAKGILGAQTNVDIDIDDAEVEDYDAIVFIGGPGAKSYFDDPSAHQLARDAIAEGKILAAICIAPSILANAGVLEGKKATAFKSEIENLKGRGALTVENKVVTDGKIITAPGPKFAKEFGGEILATMKGNTKT